MKSNTDSLFMVSCTMQDQCVLDKEYRKPTNTYLYLYTMLHYHLANKVCGVCLHTLGWRHLQQEVSMLESTYCRGNLMTDHSTKCHAVNSPQPKVRPSQDNSQWHPSFPLSRTPATKSAKQYPKITSRQYALHPEKSVAVFIPW